MRAVFARRRRDASGLPALATLWLATLCEVVAGAAAVHWDILLQDLRHTLRTLRRSPGFVLTAVPVVALGIGANTAAFSITDFVLIRPLPYADPERLVKLWAHPPGYARTELSPATYRDWKRLSTAFEGMGASQPLSVWAVGIAGRPKDSAGADKASMRFVTPGFFATMGIPRQLGRDVSEADTADRTFVAVVSRSFARRFWPGQDPLGRHFNLAFHDRVVAGVVGDIRVRGLERDSEPQVYLPYRQVADGWFSFYTPKDLAIRSAAGPAALLPAIRRIVHDADPEQPISDVRTMEDVVAAETASRAVQLRVLGAFAAIAFLLAAVGIHGLLSFAVSQRTNEIGVRIALGARSSDILAMVLRQGALLGVLGVLPGVALAYAAGLAMAALLAGVRPGDAPTFAAAVGLCLAMTLSGSLFPAYRAARVDPAAVIRKE